MKVCGLCKNEIEIDRYFSRKATCPKCRGDLHICLNCKFYSEPAHNKCLEPKAEFQRMRDKANLCDYFVFREGDVISPANREKSDMHAVENARKRLKELFKK